MSKVLTFGIAAAVLMCVGATAVAQDGGTGAGTATQSGRQAKADGKQPAAIQGVLKQLNLTPDQKAKIKAIAKKTRESVAALRKEKLDKTERKAKVLDIRKEQQEDILAVLTPEQKTKLEQILKEKRHERRAAKTGKT